MEGITAKAKGVSLYPYAMDMPPHRPAPPPGHPTSVSYGWPGGGAGRCGLTKCALSRIFRNATKPPPGGTRVSHILVV